MLTRLIVSVFIGLFLLSCTSKIALKEDGLLYEGKNLYSGDYNKLKYKSGQLFTGLDTLAFQVEGKESGAGLLDMLTYTNYKNGLRHGHYTKIQKTNNLKVVEGYYNEGKADSLWVFLHDNGQVKSKTTWTDGQKNGLSTTWYESGQIESETHYKNDKEDGEFVQYYENGQIEIAGNYIKGLQHGLTNQFYESGQLQAKFIYANGKQNGEIAQWYENGNMQMKGVVADNVPVGELTWYKEDGTLDKD